MGSNTKAPSVSIVIVIALGLLSCLVEGVRGDNHTVGTCALVVLWERVVHRLSRS
jgi:hypothetical protein